MNICFCIQLRWKAQDYFSKIRLLIHKSKLVIQSTTREVEEDNE